MGTTITDVALRAPRLSAPLLPLSSLFSLLWFKHALESTREPVTARAGSARYSPHRPILVAMSHPFLLVTTADPVACLPRTKLALPPMLSFHYWLSRVLLSTTCWMHCCVSPCPMTIFGVILPSSFLLLASLNLACSIFLIYFAGWSPPFSAFGLSPYTLWGLGGYQRVPSIWPSLKFRRAPWGKYPSHLLRDRHIPQPRGTAGPIIKCKVRSRRVLTSFLGRTKLLVRLRRLDATFAPTGCLVEDPCGFSSSASKSPWCCALGVRRELLETNFLIKATHSGHNSSSLPSRLITKVEVMEGGLSPNGTAAHEPS